MNKILIRKATLEDVESIASIHVKAWQESYKGIIEQNHLDAISFSDRLDLRKKILTFPKPAQINLVAVQENKVVGFCDAGAAFDQNDVYHGEIYAIYLLNEFKGRGIGRKLMKHVREHLELYSLIPYVAWVLEQNIGACNFYEKNGGQFFQKKLITIGDKRYIEISYLFN